MHTVLSLFLCSSPVSSSLLVFSTSWPTHCKLRLLTTIHYHHLKQPKARQHHSFLMEATSVLLELLKQWCKGKFSWIHFLIVWLWSKAFVESISWVGIIF
ncbi:hypothetical protein ACB092_05G278000 [Castanea dentata]